MLIAESLMLQNCYNTQLSISFSVEKIKQMTKMWFLVEKTGMWPWVWFKSMRLTKG